METANARTAHLPLLAATLMMFASAVSAAPARDAQAPPVNKDAATIADFMKRVDAYVTLHKKVDGSLQEPARDGRPESFLEHERAFAAHLTQKPWSAKSQRDYIAQLASLFTRALSPHSHRRLNTP